MASVRLFCNELGSKARTSQFNWCRTVSCQSTVADVILSHQNTQIPVQLSHYQLPKHCWFHVILPATMTSHSYAPTNSICGDESNTTFSIANTASCSQAVSCHDSYNKSRVHCWQTIKFQQTCTGWPLIPRALQSQKQLLHSCAEEPHTSCEDRPMWTGPPGTCYHCSPQHTRNICKLLDTSNQRFIITWHLCLSQEQGVMEEH